MELNDFVKRRLQLSYEEVVRLRLGLKEPKLNNFEIALIYHYTISGYEQLNTDLRDGKENGYEHHLNFVLDKLEDFKELVYRGVYLSSNQIEYFSKLCQNNIHFTEPAFVSCSKKLAIANMYSKGSVLFQIICKTGKNIEHLSFYGNSSSQNEKEVLFKSKCAFSVIEVQLLTGTCKITLEEI